MVEIFSELFDIVISSEIDQFLNLSIFTITMSGQPTFLRLPALFTCLVISCSAFSPSLTSTTIYKKAVLPSHFRLNAESGSVVAEKAAPVINGEALELLLMDFDEPLVIDAYADWW